MPSNEGRGYVLRRIMRRAIRHGKKLGLNAPFLHKTAGFVIEQMAEAYPDLVRSTRFHRKSRACRRRAVFPHSRQRPRASRRRNREARQGPGDFPGEVAFKLYDTFGFPLDLTRVICAEKEIAVDEAGFEQAMDRQRAESRKNWKGSGEQALNEIYLKLAKELAPGKTSQVRGL